MALCSVRSSYTDRAPGHCGEPEQPRLLAGSQGNSVATVFSSLVGLRQSESIDVENIWISIQNTVEARDIDGAGTAVPIINFNICDNKI